MIVDKYQNTKMTTLFRKLEPRQGKLILHDHPRKVGPTSERHEEVGRPPLHQVLRYIPAYDGNPDTLATFCNNIRKIRKIYGPSAEEWIFLALAEKLRGKVAEGYASRLSQYRSIEELLYDLETQYRGFSNADMILAEIKTANQQTGESARDFGLRMQTLHNRVLNTYDMTSDLDANTRRIFKASADREALDQYLLGLASDLQHQVRSEKPTNLRDAISSAVNFEHKASARRTYAAGSAGVVPRTITSASVKFLTKSSDSLQERDHVIPQEDKGDYLREEESDNRIAQIFKTTSTESWSYCHRNGHATADCRKKVLDTKFCDYCKMHGHNRGECRSLEEAIQSREVSKNKPRVEIPQPNAIPIMYASPYPPPNYAMGNQGNLQPGNGNAYKGNNNYNNNNKNNRRDWKNDRQQEGRWQNRNYNQGRNQGGDNRNSGGNRGRWNDQGSSYQGHHEYDQRERGYQPRQSYERRYPEQTNSLNSQDARRPSPAASARCPTPINHTANVR